MRLMVTIQHPAHVHFFKNAIDRFEEDGHDVRVFVRDKDVAVELLRQYGIDYTALDQDPDSILRIAAAQAAYEIRLFREARRFDPDVITAVGGLEAAHVSVPLDARSVVFTDTETKLNRLMVPFADLVCTPRNFAGDFGRKQLRYDGYHELAYLHPAQFEPRPDQLLAHGVDPSERYFVLRFSDWEAHHDVGHAGFSTETKRRLISHLSDRGRVFVSVEGAQSTPVGTPPPTPPHMIHQLLCYADVFVTDSTTMATEAALLGTPTVRSNSFADENDLSNLVELGDYGLVYSTPDETDAFETVTELAVDPEANERWRRRRERLLADKIDVTEFLVSLLPALADPAADPRDVSRAVPEVEG